MARPTGLDVTAEGDYKTKVASIITEYFVSEDAAEVATRLDELAKPLYTYYFVKSIVKTALDRQDREKELAAQLLCLLSEETLQPGQISKGFVQLLESIVDLALDVPRAPELLTLFLVRASVDDILPHAFMKVCAGSLADPLAKQVVRDAIVHLEREDVDDWIAAIWGRAETQSVEDAKRILEDLVKDFVSDGNEDALRFGLQTLGMPFFHHEFVKRLLVAALSNTEATLRLMDLLRSLTHSRELSSSQVAKGFLRAQEALTCGNLDSSAATRLEALENEARSEGLLEASEMDIPQPVVTERLEHTEEEVKAFKERSEDILREYFAAGSITDATASI
eukprot:gene5136-6248_t